MENVMSIQLQSLDEKASILTKGSKLVAWHDLYSIKDILFSANNLALVKINFEIAVPAGA